VHQLVKKTLIIIKTHGLYVKIINIVVFGVYFRDKKGQDRYTARYTDTSAQCPLYHIPEHINCPGRCRLTNRLSFRARGHDKRDTLVKNLVTVGDWILVTWEVFKVCSSDLKKQDFFLPLLAPFPHLANLEVTGPQR